jgi:subtilisin-like proprotein convertase family protein
MGKMNDEVRNMKKATSYIFGFFFFLSINLKAQTFNSGSVYSAIPDNATPLYSEIGVSGLPSKTGPDFGIEKVCINIDHPNNRDLMIFLISPDGESIFLDRFNAGASYSNTCFNGTAPDMILEGIAPFTGNYRAEGDMGKFNFYRNPNGNWKLKIQDVNPGNIGTLVSWSLIFSNSPVKPFVSSDLPIVVINTKNQFISRENSSLVDFGIIYNGSGKENKLSDSKNHYNGKAFLKYRGQSSMMFPKKSYSVTTVNDAGEDLNVPLLGMPTEHKWILYASFNDKTLLRNVFSYNLYGSFGHYSIRSKYVELIVDGDYRGTYVLMERIKRDRNRVRIKKLSPEDVEGDALTGGYIFSIDKIDKDSEGWYSKYPSNTNNNAAFFQYIYPNPGKMPQVQKDYLRNYIMGFEDVLQSSGWLDPEMGYKRFIEMNSFHDNFIINELSRDIDAYRVSTYFYKDRDSEGGKIVNGPVWDFDMAWFNANFGGGDKVVGWQYQFGYEWREPNPGDSTYVVPFWWRKFMQDPEFVDRLWCRYHTLRRNQLTLENLYSQIDQMTEEITQARTRNFDYWPIMGKWVYSNISPVAQTYEQEVNQMKNWIKGRLTWMDNNLPGSCNEVGTENEKIAVSAVNAYPNPFREGFNINYFLRNSTSVSIELYNSLGIKVRQIYEGQMVSGFHNNAINTQDLAAGLYMVVLKAEGKIFNVKLIKAN